MLNSLYIKNFRLFKELKIEQLSRVNLILGRNNSGKTCLLEALNLYANNASVNTIYQLILERREDWKIRKQHLQSTLYKSPLRYLFYNYPKLENSDYIEIGSLKGDRLKLNIQAYKIETEYTRNLTDDDIQELFLEVETNDIKYRVPLDKLEELSKFSKNPKFNIQIVSTNNLDEIALSILWDNINLQPSLRKEVFKWVQLIDKKIEEIVFIGQEKDITPIVIYKDSEEQMPLKHFGDGIYRIFHIILALINAKDGFLLIDEFENGLHYTVQAQIWELIFKLAKQLNIQVFATTHSKDCVEGFHSVWENQEQEGSLHRLDNDPDEGIIVMPYNSELVGYALENDGEIR